MKTLITLIICLASISCNDGLKRPDAKSESSLPVESFEKQPPLKVIGKYNVSGGWLYVYTINTDTVYIVEGFSTQYPVSISVKP